MQFRIYRNRALLIAIGWVCVSVFFATVRELTIGAGRSFGYALWTTALEFGFWALAFPFIEELVRRFPLDEGARVRNAVVMLGVLLPLAMFASLEFLAILFWAWKHFSYYPAFYPSDMYPTFWRLMSLRLFRFTEINLLFACLLWMLIQGWRVWQNYQTEKLRSHDLQRQLAVAHLQTLRMQLHPHFLFNTLHTIASMVTEQPSTARRMLTQLGDFLRLTLKDNTHSLRSLAEELEFADLYLGIEKLRLGDQLILHYDIEPDATKAQVPCLFLQPLFENAVRHGAARMVAPCDIIFRAYRQDERLMLNLENDGPIRSEPFSQTARGVGLNNTLERLRLHYGDDFIFQYRHRVQGGVLIEISLPYNSAPDRDFCAGIQDQYSYTHS